MIDMSKTTAPKSDQMNYDDFLSGDKTITITGVKSTGNVTDQQPVSVGYQGDNGKPYKPCKSMRRVMVRVWGNDAIEYVGKSMTLFGDANVIFAGQKVGGIRISHMSHIDTEINVPLTASKTKRMLYKVKPLKVDMVDTDLLDDARNEAKNGKDSFTKWFNTLSKEDRAQVKTIMPELQNTCEETDNTKQKVDDPFEEHFDNEPQFDVDAFIETIKETNDNGLLSLLQNNNQSKIDALSNDDKIKITDTFTSQFDNNNKSE